MSAPPRMPDQTHSLASVSRSRREDPVLWLTILFAASFLTMRVALVPNSAISVTTALVLAWSYLAWRHGILTLEPRRLGLWLAAAGASALAPIAQFPLVSGASSSLSSWALWNVLWLPTIFRLVDADRSNFLRTCRAIGWCGFGIAVLSLAFLGFLAAGVPYRDYFAEYFPRQFQVVGFSTTVPITWGNPIHKSNAWLALEPSFVSFWLGAALIAALIARHRWWVSVTILLGIFSSFAGSGLALLAMAAVVVILSGQTLRYARSLGAGIGLFLAAYLTPIGTLVFSRVDEVTQGQSSTALRATLPYEQLLPEFFRSVPGVIFGYGAGSSRQVVEGTSMLGLLVPNPVKLIFDYGLLAGVLLLLAMVVAHLGSPAPAIAIPILASFLFLQAATQPMITVLLILATWWAPSAYRISGPQRSDPNKSV